MRKQLIKLDCDYCGRTETAESGAEAAKRRRRSGGGIWSAAT